MSEPSGTGIAPRLFLVNFEVRRDSRALAWQRQVLCALAARCERVVVLTESGDDDGLPGNVELHRVPRLLQKAPLRWLGGRSLMVPWCRRWVRRARINMCFVHMNMPWVARLGPMLRAARVPIVLWYAHGSVTNELRGAEQWADAIVTSSPEGFRLPTNKLTVIGQGIDSDLFAPGDAAMKRGGVVTVGRLSERKRIDRIIDSFAEVVRDRKYEDLRLTIVGTPLTQADEVYAASLRRQVQVAGLEGRVEFAGHVSHDQLPAYYRRAALHLNLSDTGSMDKTVLESLACGCPVLTSNVAYRELFRDHSLSYLSEDAPVAVAARMRILLDNGGGSPNGAEELRALVVGRHDLRAFVDKLLARFALFTKSS